ncbi:MAG: hypothetical protein K2W95_26295 [Candidatus Obscuribacterales bacterium]|nr:hypothetical protein [Candidatus Obscuribacterales bacterium]
MGHSEMYSRFALPLLSVLTVLGSALVESEFKAAASAPIEHAPVTVVEFFRLLPQKYSGISELRKKELLTAGTTVTDVRNGFMEYSDCAESRSQIAIFKTAKGERIVGVTYIGQAIDPKTENPVDASEFHMLQYRADKWSDLTKLTFPRRLSRGDWVELPRTGTVIKLHLRDGKEVSYKWSGYIFSPISR